MAAELKQAFGIHANIIAGSNGIFDVIVDGRKIYSKHDTGRFPEPGEIVRMIHGH